MIQGIDIFEPRDNGLPDFTKIGVGQIFNGSVAASMNQTLDPYGLNEKDKTEGIPESSAITTTIDPTTGRRVEIRKAQVVEEFLGGGSAVRRGHPKANSQGRRSSSGGGNYTTPDYGNIDDDLPSNPTPTEGGSSLLPGDGPPITPSGWHPPMKLDFAPNGPESILLPPDGFTPEEEKTSTLQRLPTMLLEELKNLHLV